MFYKIIKDNSILGVATSDNLIRYQLLHKMYLMASESSAEAIMCNETIYHSNWMLEFKAPAEYIEADIVSIDEDEYEALVEAFETNETVEDDSLIEPEEEVVEEIPEELTVAFVKEAKIKEMKNACRYTIENGVDVVLSDGKGYHFSLTTQDQLNLTTLSAMVESGETSIPYHADGELCKYYSVEDILTIISAAKNHIAYHTTYYNSLKSYVSSLKSINTISAIAYGCSIPEKYQSQVLASLLNSEENN